MKISLLILLIALPKIVFSQSIILTDVSSQNYPRIDCEYMLLDDNDNKLAPDISDLQLKENGIVQQITDYSCENSQKPEPISVVITIDNSASMLATDGNPTDRATLARNVAKRFVDILNPISEIAITYFATDCKYLQPFTTDKDAVKTAIDNIPEPFGNTYITKAFMDPTDGNFRALENAKYKKVIIFLTDGVSREVDQATILSRAKQDSVTIFSMSIYSELDKELVNLARLTGGKSFEDIRDPVLITNIFRALAHIASGVPTCNLSYISDNCSRDRDIELTYKENVSAQWKLNIPKEALVEYKVAPLDIILQPKGVPSTFGYTNIVSNRDSLIITDISSKYSEVTIDEPVMTAFPIRLNTGDRLRIRVSCPADGITRGDIMEISTNSCEDQAVTVAYMPIHNELAILQPNGGEQYYVGSVQSVKWKDSNLSNKYNLEYSTDAGFEWKPLVNNYNAKDFEWLSVPDKVTDEALMRVTPIGDIANLAKTKNVGNIEPNFFSEFDNILPLDSNRYLVSTRFRDSFDYRGLHLDTVGQSNKDKNKVRRVLLILDENLDVISSKVIYDNCEAVAFATIKGNIYLLGESLKDMQYDTLDFVTDQSKSSTTLLMKINPDLSLNSYKRIVNKNILASGADYLIDFKSSENYLHIFGACSETLEYDSALVIKDFSAAKISYIMRVDTNLNFIDANYWDGNLDKFDLKTKGIIPQSDDKVLLWGSGFGYNYLGLDSNFTRVLALLSTYGSKDLFIKNYISFDESTDFTLMDFESYKNINYYLLRTTDTTYLDSETISFGKNSSKVRLLAVSDDNTLIWDKELDNFALDKNIEIVNNRDIIIAGGTNEAFSIGDTTVPRSGGTHFIASLNLFNGKFNWLRYVRNATYKNLIASNDKYILTNGNLHADLDFGNGFVVTLNGQIGESQKQYLWELEAGSTGNFDISDSLWSIRKPSFKYIDTIDFGKVYVGSIKDSLVTGFIKRVLPGDVTVKSINIDDFRFTSDFVGPVNLADSIDITITFDTHQSGAGLSRGTIETTQGDYYFYLKAEEVELRYSPASDSSLIIDFGDVFVSEQKAAIRKIVENEGGAVIGIDSIVVLDDENNEFSYSVTPVPTHIFSLDSLMAQFTYQPKLAGLSEAKVEFYLDIDEKPITAFLKGNGKTRDSLRLKVIADSLSAFPDNLTFVPLELEISENPSSLDLQRIEVYIHFNATLLLPFRFEDDGKIINKTRYLTLNFEKEDIEKLSLVSRFIPTIGNSISTVLTIDSARAYNSKNELITQSVIEKENGLFTLDGVCFSDGQYRLYEESQPASIKILKENEDFFVVYNLLEDGVTNLSVYDISGRLISTLENSKLEQGEHRAKFNTRNIANGNYIVRLETPTQIISKIFTVAK